MDELQDLDLEETAGLNNSGSTVAADHATPRRARDKKGKAHGKKVCKVSAQVLHT